MTLDHAEFIRAQTRLVAPPLVPEIRLHLATEVTPLWLATESQMQAMNLPPPYWAFAWPGGQAVSRHLLDHPEIVRGKRVLDFAAGSGLGAVACALAGASRVLAAEIDPLAISAILLNAGANGVAVEIKEGDVIGDPLPEIDVILAGDVCYERPMAERVIGWLRPLASRKTVLMGDPGRNYLPKEGLERIARHAVPTPLDLEDKEVRVTDVFRLLPG